MSMEWRRVRERKVQTLRLEYYEGRGIYKNYFTIHIDSRENIEVQNKIYYFVKGKISSKEEFVDGILRSDYWKDLERARKLRLALAE